MPFVAPPLLAAAVEALRGKHVLAVLVIPAMVRAGVKEAADADHGTAFGSLNEVEILDAFFRVPGGPADRPYRAVWEDDLRSLWRDGRYPGRTLQRIRTDRVKGGEGFFQKKESPTDLWALRSTAGSDLAAYIGDKVRIVDLAIWYGREQDVADLDALISWFKGAFLIEQAGLVGTIYSEDVPAHYREIPFAADELSQTDYAQILGGAPEAPKLEKALADFATELRVEVEKTGFITAEGLVERVVAGWAKGDIVVLVGHGGTGKTRFANSAAQALKAILGELEVVWVPVRSDFDEGDLVGYERLDGSSELRPFAVRVLQSETPLGPHLVVLEEFNLTALEAYLGSVLIATEDSARRISLPGGQEVRLPVDTLILATCNSYLDEPETRHRLSFPSKRRAAIISMPNVVLERYEQYEREGKDGASAILDLTLAMIRQEQLEIDARIAAGLGSTFDFARRDSLASVGDATALSEKVRDRWTVIAKALLATPEGKEFLTLSIVKDVALDLAYAARSEDPELTALGRSVADKIVHQLRGPKDRADALFIAVGDVPNRNEISRLLDRMKSGPGTELLPLV